MGLEIKLKDIIEPELKIGHFTDAYVSCGSFESGKILYSRSWQSKSATVFDLASLTKALVTAPLIYHFLWERKIDASASLKAWADIPTLHPDLSTRSTYELLAHISGLPAWWNFWITRLDANSAIELSYLERRTRIEEVFRRIPVNAPGKDLYSDIGYITLGYALEYAEQKDLQSLWKEWLKYVGMDPSKFRLAFRNGLGDLERGAFIPTAYCPLRRRLLQGEVHDENCAALGGIAGHAGLFGSGEALDTYLLRLYQSEQGFAFLNENFKKIDTTNHEGLFGLRRGTVASAQVFARGRAMGHLGFTGTAFWIDWERKLFASFLTNRVCSGRLPTRIGEVRAQVFGTLYEAFA